MNIIKTTAAALALTAATAMGAHAGDGYKKSGMKADKSSMTKTMQSASLSAEQSAMFDSMDNDKNREIDFTEFSNYLEQNYGYSAGDSAKEYVRLATGERNVITDMSFAGLNVADLPHKHMDGTKHNMDGSTQSASTTMSNQQTAVMGSTSFGNYGSFGDYDMNGDGTVNFSEYSQYRAKSGVRTTQAAQEFIRFSDGQAQFDQSAFERAASMDVLSRKAFREN